MNKEEDKIVITSWPYTDKDGHIHPSMVNTNKQLSERITEYYERVLEPLDIEIFKQEHNIIATSKGFYGAFFEKDLKHAE